MSAVNLRIQHLDHQGSLLTVHYPVGSSLRWKYVANDIGDISYDLSLTDDYQLAFGPDAFAPYRTDYRLQISATSTVPKWENLQGGIHTSASLKPRTGTVGVAGRDWLHWLDQPIWFDFYVTEWDVGDLKNLLGQWTKGNKDADFDAKGFFGNFAAYAWVGRLGATQQSAIKDIFHIMNTSTSYPENRVTYRPNFNNTPKWDSLLSYTIFVQDETSVLDHIKTIASMSDPYGYDFYCDWDKRVYFFGPRKTLATSPNPVWILTNENVVIDTVPDLDWTNNGPMGTYIIGLGPGSPALWWLKADQPTIDKYRRYLRLVRVGDAYQGRLTGVRYGTSGLQYGYPQKDLKLSVYPDKLVPMSGVTAYTNPLTDGYKNHIGDVVRFRWEFSPYHTIDASFWITQQEYHSDAAGNWICDLGLQQIYA